jgi:hypothetical protein
MTNTSASFAIPLRNIRASRLARAAFTNQCRAPIASSPWKSSHNLPRQTLMSMTPRAFHDTTRNSSASRAGI